MDEQHTSSGNETARFDTRRDDVVRLIEDAAQHPLGVDFLRHGALDAVAAIFGVHAFTVDAARDALDAGADLAKIQVGTDLAGTRSRSSESAPQPTT